MVAQSCTAQASPKVRRENQPRVGSSFRSLLVGLFGIWVLANPSDALGNGIGVASSGLTSPRPTTNSSTEPQENSGAYSRNIAIEVRPARGEKTTPQLALDYRSDRAVGVAGVGWTVPLAYVEEDFFGRVPTAADTVSADGFSDRSFTYTGAGQRCGLVTSPGQPFRCDVQRGGYMKFELVQDDGTTHWVAHDADGTMFVFGLRVDFDPAQPDGHGTQRWYLTEVLDSNDNWARYDYRGRGADSACLTTNAVDHDIVLKTVRWNNTAVPDDVTAVDFGVPRCTDGSFRDRARFGFVTRTRVAYQALLGRIEPLAVVLDGIQVESRHGAGPWTPYRGYDLTYEQGPVTGRDRLTSVRVAGKGCSVFAPTFCQSEQWLPATLFSYSDGVTQMKSLAEEETVSGLPQWLKKESQHGADTYVSLQDFDGDGRRDMVIEEYGTAAPGGNTGAYALTVKFGNGTGWDPPQIVWPAHEQPAYGSPTTVVLDLDGDGRMDLLRSDSGAFVNLGDSIDRDESQSQAWPNPLRYWDFSAAIAHLKTASPIAAVRDCVANATNQIGSLLSCTSDQDFGPDSQGQPTTWIQSHARLVDLTGDGIQDLVVGASATSWWVYPGFKSGQREGGVQGTPIVWSLPSPQTAWSQAPRSEFVLVTDTELGSYDRQQLNYLTDINADGLLDLLYTSNSVPLPIQRTSATTVAALNVGNGFVVIPWTHRTMPLTRRYSPHLPGGLPDHDADERIVDFNADGYPDFIKKQGCGGNLCITFGSDAGFRIFSTPLTTYAPAHVAQYLDKGDVLLSDGSGGTYYGFIDIDDDGVLDHKTGNVAGAWKVVRADTSGMDQSIYADLLVRIDNGLGSGEKVSYRAASSFEGTYGPGARAVVSRIEPFSKADSPGPAVDLRYSGGARLYDPVAQRYLWTGFETTTVEKETGESTEYRFEVADLDLVGMPKAQYRRDRFNCPYEDVVTTYDKRVFAGGVIVYPRLVVHNEREFGMQDCRSGPVAPLGGFVRHRGITEVDWLGNVEGRYEDDDVARWGDELCTRTTYAASPGVHVANRPSRVEVLTNFNPLDGTCSRTLRATNYYYDGALHDAFHSLPQGQVAEGNLKIVEEELYTVAPPSVLVDQFVTKRFAYDWRGHQVRAFEMMDAQNGKGTRTSVDLDDALFATSVRKEGTGRCCLPQRSLVTSLDYDYVQGLVTFERAPNGVKTYREYDDFGRVVWTETEGVGEPRVRIEEIEYAYIDADGDGALETYRERVTKLDPDHGSRVLTTDYDGLGRKQSVTETLGSDHGGASLVTTYFYAESGELYEETGPIVQPAGSYPGAESMSRIHVKDARGRPWKDIVFPTAAYQMTPAYTDAANWTSITEYEYGIWEDPENGDAVRHVTSIHAPFDPAFPHAPGASVPAPMKRYVDAKGRVVRTDDRNGQSVTFGYDALGHLETVHRTLQYPGVNELVETRIEVDALGRRTALADPDKGTTRYEHDFAGNITRISRADALSPTEPTQALVLEYDTLGRLERKRSQSCVAPTACTFADHPTDWVFDGEVETAYYYDTASRLPAPLDAEHPGPGQAEGQLIAIHEGTRSGANTDDVIWYGYDSLGRRTLEGTTTGPISGPQLPPPPRPVFFSVKVLGTATEKALAWVVGEGRWPGAPVEPGGTAPAGYTQHAHFELRHDSAGYLRGIDDPATGRTMYDVTDVDPRGLPNEAKMADGTITVANTYAPDGRLLTTNVEGASGVAVGLVYEDFDGTGNLLRMTDTRYATTYRYEFDADAQLVRATSGAGGLTPNEGWAVDVAYAYDSFGNMRRLTDSVDPSRSRELYYPDDGTRAQTLVGYDELGTMMTQSVSSEFGNITHKAGADYRFSVEDRLQEVTTASGDQMHYAYAGTNNWVRRGTYRSGALDEYRFRVAEGVQVDRTNTANAYLEIVFSVGPLRVFRRRVELASPAATDEFFAVDHLGSVRSVLDDQGNEITAAAYHPYGARRYGGADRTGFAGHEQVDTTGLVDMGARHYDPTLGRFVSADSLVPDAGRSIEFNRFAYAQNNPVSLVDRDGRDPIAVSVVFNSLLWIARSVAYLSQLEDVTLEEALGTIVKAAVVGAALGAVRHFAGDVPLLSGALKSAIIGSVERQLSRIVLPKTNVGGGSFGELAVGELRSIGIGLAASMVGSAVSPPTPPSWAADPTNVKVGNAVRQAAAGVSAALLSHYTRGRMSEHEENRLPGAIAGALVNSTSAFIGGGASPAGDAADAIVAPPNLGLFAERVGALTLHELVRIGSIYTAAVVDDRVNAGTQSIGNDGLSVWARFGRGLNETYLNTSSL